MGSTPRPRPAGCTTRACGSSAAACGWSWTGPSWRSFPDYGLVRTRLDFDDMLARQAVEAGAVLRTSVNVTGPVLDERAAAWSASRRKTGRRGPRSTARRWWSRPTASPAGSRSRWAWPSATTGRWAWPCAATTTRRPRHDDDYLESWLELRSTRGRRQAAARVRLDLRHGRRPGQRGPGRAQLVGGVRQDQLPRDAHRLAGHHARRSGA